MSGRNTGSTSRQTSPSPITTAKGYRERRKVGRPWRTPSGEVVFIRDLDITDHATINQFPTHLRRMVYDTMQASQALALNQDATPPVNPFAELSPEETLKAEAELGNILVKLGWISPQVVDDSEISGDDDERLGISEVDSKDRRAYMTLIMNSYIHEAQALAPFPERPDGGMDAGSDVPAVPSSSEPTDAVGAERVLRSDSV